MKQDLVLEIAIPESVQVEVDGVIVIKGPKGEVRRALTYPGIIMRSENSKLILESKKATKREKRMLGTFQAHVKNMIKGVIEGFTYELKICSGHFPMNVSVSGKELIIKNFLGENFPRKITIREGATVNVEGDKIVIESTDKEVAGQVAADIEQLTIIRGRDIRIFQDGCYITRKGEKVIGS